MGIENPRQRRQRIEDWQAQTLYSRVLPSRGLFVASVPVNLAVNLAVNLH